MKGMRREDIKPCPICHGPLNPNGQPDVYEVTVTQHILDNRAIMQHAGLEMHFGGGRDGAALANIMGPTREFSAPMSSGRVIICNSCALSHPVIFKVWSERPEGGEVPT